MCDTAHIDLYCPVYKFITRGIWWYPKAFGGKPHTLRVNNLNLLDIFLFEFLSMTQNERNAFYEKTYLKDYQRACSVATTFAIHSLT